MLINSLSSTPPHPLSKELLPKSSQRTKSLELTLGSNEFSSSRLGVYQTLLVPPVYLSRMLKPLLYLPHLRELCTLPLLNHTDLAHQLRLAMISLTRHLLLRGKENQIS